MRIQHWMLTFILVSIGALASGCQGNVDSAKGNKTKAPTSGVKAEKGGAHDHPNEGPHGGALAEWGDEEFHAEFTVDHKMQEATVYILDSSAKNSKPIKATSITLALKLQPPITITLSAKPQDGDSAGASSRFAGKHETLGTKQNFSGTISGDINGKPYAGDFKEEEHKDGKPGDGKQSRTSVMPEGAGGTPAERNLFLTPGGIYAAADIKANGNAVPSDKYRGISWPHDDDLQPGDRICPVTTNKADERCTWIVNGKKYEFCCTPCLDKFVKLAKQQPEKIKDPEAYIKK